LATIATRIATDALRGWRNADCSSQQGSAPMTHYNTTGKFQVLDESTLQNHLRVQSGRYYIYILCRPPSAMSVQPFYGGIGQGDRLFAHEREAQAVDADNPKLRTIRGIWASGCQVLRYLDGVFAETPWRREQELIAQFGLLKDGTGVLTNEQRYSPSFVVAGVELRKYAPDGNELPSNFVRRDCRLLAGPRKPKNPASVYGKIYAVLEKNPKVTGAELVELLLDFDFSDNGTTYTQSGQVSRPWLAKYIDGGFYAKNQCIQEAPIEGKSAKG
jgi:hypothetical protein